MLPKTVGNDLHHALAGEDYEKDILYFFLKENTECTMLASDGLGI